jgi:hypothetical protein
MPALNDKHTSDDGMQVTPEIVMRILAPASLTTGRDLIFGVLGQRSPGPIPISTDGVKTEFLESITNAYHGFGRAIHTIRHNDLPNPRRLPRHEDVRDPPKISIVLNLAVNVSAYKLLAYLRFDNPDLLCRVGLTVICPPARDPLKNPWVAAIVYHKAGVGSLNITGPQMSYFTYPNSALDVVHGELMGMELMRRAATEFTIDPLLATYPEYLTTPIILDGGEISTVTAPTASPPPTTISSLNSPLTTSATSRQTEDVESLRQTVQSLSIQTAVLLQVQMKACRSEIREIQARLDTCEPGSAAKQRLIEDLWSSPFNRPPTAPS